MQSIVVRHAGVAWRLATLLLASLGLTASGLTQCPCLNPAQCVDLGVPYQTGCGPTANTTTGNPPVLSCVPGSGPVVGGLLQLQFCDPIGSMTFPDGQAFIFFGSCQNPGLPLTCPPGCASGPSGSLLFLNPIGSFPLIPVSAPISVCCGCFRNFPIQVPANPSLCGLTICAQGVARMAFGGGSPCLSVSQGLALTFGC